jgi:predicted nucleic acid-binding protein
MNVYLDSSFVIRQLLGVRPECPFWGKWDKAYASTLMRTECYRAANLLRLSGKIDDAQRARLGAWIEKVVSSVVQVPVTDAILRRAAETFPIAVGTLQGIHLATLLELQAARGISCSIATDDTQLLQAATALGFAEAVAEEPKREAEQPEDSAPTADKPSA